MLLCNSEQIRRADEIMIQDMQYPGLLLMEEAGRKATEAILERFSDHADFLVLAGPGNNGGDGLVIARYLVRAGKQVRILLSHDPERYRGDARVNFQALTGAPVEMDTTSLEIPSDAVLIDCLLGTGLSDSLRGRIRSLIEVAATHPGPRVAIDLPSGLDASSGALIPGNPDLIRADLTLTFQTAKVCHAVHPAAALCGEVQVLDIGIWPSVLAQLGVRRHWLAAELVGAALRARPVAGHKGTFGHALLIGGSATYPGAVALAGHAALHIGAGLASVLAPDPAAGALFALGPEVIFRGFSGAAISRDQLELALEHAAGKALALGPGWTTDPGVQDFFLAFLEAQTAPLVLDADALNLLAATQCWDLLPKGSILTPHPGEMRRLLGGEISLDHRLELAEETAQKHHLTVVLKGAGTIVASPEGTWVNPTGNPGMGTGGSGDVLTGVITGLLAQGLKPAEAARAGVYLHGLAGDLAAEQYGQAGVTATRILEQLGPARQQIEQEIK